MTTRLTPKTGWTFYKGSRRSLQTASSGSRANLQTASLSLSTWDQTHRQHSSSSDDWWNFFSELGQVWVAWRKTYSQPTGSVNSTPTNTARTELHSMITFHHANTRGSRAAKLRIAHLRVLKNNCHPRVMSHSFAAPDTDHKHKFSLTYLTYFSYLSDSLTDTHTRSMVLDLDIPCDVPRQSCGPTQIPSLTFFWYGHGRKQQQYPYYVRGDEPHMCKISDDELENDS